MTGYFDPVSPSTLVSSLKLGYMLENEPRVCPGTCNLANCTSPTNADINRANLILSQSAFCASGAITSGLTGAIYGTTSPSVTAVITSITVENFDTINPKWWGGRVLKDQIQVFNYQKSQVLNVGFSLDYTITDASTKQIVTSKAGTTESLSWLNPTHDHLITFTAGAFDSNPQTFAVSTVTTPPVEESLIDAYQVPANIKAAATNSSLTQYILNPNRTVFCGTVTSNVCENAEYYFVDDSVFSTASFLLPKGTNAAPSFKDESRITYTLQAESAALTGEYKILVPEGAFTR